MIVDREHYCNELEMRIREKEKSRKQYQQLADTMPDSINPGTKQAILDISYTEGAHADYLKLLHHEYCGERGTSHSEKEYHNVYGQEFHVNPELVSHPKKYPDYTGLHWEAQIDRATSQKVYGATIGDYLFVVYPMYHEGEEKYTGEIRSGPKVFHTAGFYNTVKEAEIALESWGADNLLIGTQIARRRNEEKYYAIYYFRGVDYYPATGPYTDVKDVYSTAQEAVNVAKQLAEVFPDTEFGVYPVNHNYEITGRPVRTFNAGMDQ